MIIDNKMTERKNNIDKHQAHLWCRRCVVPYDLVPAWESQHEHNLIKFKATQLGRRGQQPRVHLGVGGEVCKDNINTRRCLCVRVLCILLDMCSC